MSSNCLVECRPPPGVGKESGLVTGTVRHGVPLIVSDHDPDLTALLTGQDCSVSRLPGAMRGSVRRSSRV